MADELKRIAKEMDEAHIPKEVWIGTNSTADRVTWAWQPIKTAPKDGEDVFLWIPEDEEAVIGFWRDDAKAWDTWDGWLQGKPSHWMRPDPPDFTLSEVESKEPSTPNK